MRSIQQRIASGIIWMVAARLIDRSIGVLSTLILARLLVPEDFGIVAMAAAIGAVLELMGAFNFDLALIQKKDAGKQHYDTAWTYNVLFGLFCGAALIATAGLAASYYREPRLENVMYVFSLSYVLSGLTNIGVVNFRRELAFRDDFLFMLIRRAATFGVTLVAAFTLRSYWALVIGILVGRGVSLWASFWMSSYRPRFSLAATGQLFNFSRWVLVNNVLFFLMHSGPSFVIGRLNGAMALGTYTVAYEISNLPSTELVAPINRAAYPGFAKMASPAAMAKSYEDLLGLIVLLIVPVGIGIAAVAEPAVLVVLGTKWLEAIPLIELLAMYGALAATQTTYGVVWMVLGRPFDLSIYCGVFVVVLFAALFYMLPTIGLVGAAYAYVLAQVSVLPGGLWNTKRLLAMRWNSLLRVVWRPIFAVTIMYVSVKWVDAAVADRMPVFRLAIDIASGVAVYAVCVVMSWLLVGRPEGAEAACIRRCVAALGRESHDARR
ncbi:MAG: lipopolysaccharide biosynthesis protein [Betaproteobacteria bacterium]